MAKRPKGTYVSNVFNPGFDKNLPFGFVNVVYSNDGEPIGFMKGDNFYKLGEVADDATPKRQRADAKGVPGIQEQKAAQSERDFLSNKLKDLENKGQKNSPEWQSTYQDYLAAQKRLDDVNQKIEDYVNKNKEYKDEWQAAKSKQQENAYQEVQDIVTTKEEAQSAKEAARNEKKRKQLEAEKADAERRGDKAAAAKAQQDINNIPKAPAKTKTTTPTEAEPRSARAQEAGVNKVKPSTTKATTSTATANQTTTPGTSGSTGNKAATPNVPAAQKETKADRQLTAEQILNEYKFVDAIINQDPKIKKAYTDFVNNKITKDRFKNVVITSDFVAKNSSTIRQRIFDKSTYQELGPEDQASRTSSYAQGVDELFRELQAQAKTEGAVPTDEELKLIADRIYMLGQENDTNVKSAALRPYVRAGINAEGMATVGGAAGSNYSRLVQAAYNNGISASEMPRILGYDSPDAILQALQSGEAITTLEQRIRNFASTGQSDFVKQQLASGVNMRAIAGPYIEQMATTLEIQPDSIKLNDPMVQAALQNQGMTLFDFKKLLRKDNRWQYTKAAETDVADATMRILRDFGFEA